MGRCQRCNQVTPTCLHAACAEFPDSRYCELLGLPGGGAIFGIFPLLTSGAGLDKLGTRLGPELLAGTTVVVVVVVVCTVLGALPDFEL